MVLKLNVFKVNGPKKIIGSAKYGSSKSLGHLRQNGRSSEFGPRIPVVVHLSESGWLSLLSSMNQIGRSKIEMVRKLLRLSEFS